MKEFIKKNKKYEEAWIIHDRDNWTENDLNKITLWSNESKRYNSAISNPCFEYWLLLHFESGNGVTNKNKCLEKLKTYLPTYTNSNKGLERCKFTLENIQKAIDNAKLREHNLCYDKCNQFCYTKVYLLVEKIIAKDRELS